MTPPAPPSPWCWASRPRPSRPAAELRRLIFESLLAWIAGLATGGPVVLIAEDIHWADASTLDFLRQLGDRIAHDARAADRLASQRLRRVWPARLADAAPGAGPAAQCGRREAGGGRRRPACRRACARPSWSAPRACRCSSRSSPARWRPRARCRRGLPGSLSQLLTARLDGIGSARALAQMAAVVGREVPVRMLAALSGLDPGVFASAVEVLVQSGVMMHVGSGADAALAFRHALLGDVAYQALPSDRQRALHQRVADVLGDDPTVRPGDPGPASGRRPAILAAGQHPVSRGGARMRWSPVPSSKLPATRGGRWNWPRSSRRARGDRAVLGALVSLGSVADGDLGLRQFRGAGDLRARGPAGVGRRLRARPAAGAAWADRLLPGARTADRARGTSAEPCCSSPARRQRAADRRIRERRLGWCRLCQGVLGEARALFDAALASLECADGGPPGFDEDSTRTLTLAALAWLDWLTEGDEAALARAAQVADQAERARRPIISAYGLGFAAAVHQMTGDAGRGACLRAALSADRGGPRHSVLDVDGRHAVRLEPRRTRRRGGRADAAARRTGGVFSHRKRDPSAVCDGAAGGRGARGGRHRARPGHAGRRPPPRRAPSAA